MQATRMAIFLLNLGFQDVRILDGGVQAWNSFINSNEKLYENLQYQFMVQGQNSQIQSCDKVFNFQKQDLQRQTNFKWVINDLQQINQFLQDQENYSVISIRSMNEFNGKETGYDYIKQKGCIPGAKWGHGGLNSQNMNDFENIDGTMRAGNEIEEIWRQNNILRSQNNIFYCGTGWRASQSLFYAYVLGWKNICLFDGGWYQWVRSKYYRK
ncbi:Rhodanese-like domain [Pseudocohnilembus persalinus]|uniref:Rhodanese-like domain n=1 Tax=Pseudocohnilembus persalinus TaxID=266149 RepID=A0A0V0QP29_PSEPJ|nr:Rhodanese-like domain [Pseudocohnilembus persalinus]|eukprot:KRX04034.1 Rhodanese-like domain [Pseudocohnilembus persalinus]